jgi:cytochrome bd-type quinol oxidase subunit 2
MNLHKVTKIAAIVISVISILFLAGLMATSDDKNNGWISPLIYMSYFVLFACIAIVLVYVFKNLLSDKENFKKTLISIGIFLGIILISFIFADGSDMKVGDEVATGATSKLVSTGLNAFYFLSVIAIGTMAWTGLTKFKK